MKRRLVAKGVASIPEPEPILGPASDRPVTNAHATYTIGIWGKCKVYLRSEDNKPAASHNHRPCTCPECAKRKQKWYLCIMTEQWMRESDITKTTEQGG